MDKIKKKEKKIRNTKRKERQIKVCKDKIKKTRRKREIKKIRQIKIMKTERRKTKNKQRIDTKQDEKRNGEGKTIRKQNKTEKEINK